MGAYSSILDSFFPIQCVLCQSHGAYLCAHCKKTISTHHSMCPLCHRPSIHYQTCRTCLDQTPLRGCIIGFSYSGAIKKIIHLLKYKHISSTSMFLANQLARHLRTHPLMTHDISAPPILCPIPTHRSKVLFRRGYDHIEILARHLSEACAIPQRRLLRKSRFTRSQVGLSRSQRYGNLLGSFQITDGIDIFGNETILLVDDLLTSGATLTMAAHTLLARRPDLRLWGLVMSRHVLL